MKLVLILLLALGGVAHADDRQSARAHFDRGWTLYGLGQYSDAAHEYEASFKLDPEPSILLNIAQAYRLAGDGKSALRSYRAYLARVPQAPNREQVRAQIAALEKLDGTEPVRAHETPRAPLYKRWYVWTPVAAVIALGVGLGVGLGLNTPRDQFYLPPDAHPVSFP